MEYGTNDQLMEELARLRAELAVARRRDLSIASSPDEGSEMEFLALYEEAPVGYAECALDGRILRANRSLRRILGYTSEEVCGKHASDFAKEPEAVVETVRSIGLGEEPVVVRERVYIRKDGTEVMLLIENRLVRDASGAADRFRATVLDVSGRRHTEDQLRLSEAEFRDLYDNAPIGYIELDVEGRITRVNRSQLAMLDYTAEEMLGRPVWQFLKNSEEARVSLLARLKLEEPFLPVERLYLTKSGKEVPVLIDNRLLRDPEGRVKGVRAVIQDISALKQVEEQLRRSESEFRDLYDNAPVGYMELDTSGTIARVNKSTLTLLGYKEEALLGHKIWEFVEAGERQASKDALAARFHDMERFSSVERTLLRSDGSAVQVLVENGLLRDGDYRVTGLRCAIQDITMRKQAEEALRQIAIRQERQDAARHMLHVLMHEVYNPLTGILGNLTLLGMETMSPGGRESLREIDVCARRIQSALRELAKLDLADPSPITGVTTGDTRSRNL